MEQTFRQSIGFTLIELLTAIAILSIVLAIAVPAMGAFIDSSRVQSFSDHLKADLRLARFEANKSGMRITLCASSNNSQCAGSIGDGWIVFNDANANGSVDAGENLVLASGTVEPGVTAKVLANDGTSVNSMVYNYRGYLNQELTATVSRNGSSHVLELSRSGRVELL